MNNPDKGRATNSTNALNTVILKLESDLNFLHKNLNVSHSRFVQLSQLFKSTLDQVANSASLLKRELTSNASLEEKLKTCDNLMNVAHLMAHSLNVLNPPEIMTVVGNANGIPYASRPQEGSNDFYQRSAPTSANISPETYAMLKNAHSISQRQLHMRNYDHHPGKLPIPAPAPVVSRRREIPREGPQPPPRPSSVEMLQQALFNREKPNSPQNSPNPASESTRNVPTVNAPSVNSSSVNSPTVNAPSVNAPSVNAPHSLKSPHPRNSPQVNLSAPSNQGVNPPSADSRGVSHPQESQKSSPSILPNLPDYLRNYLDRWDIETFKRFPITSFRLTKSATTVFELFDYWYSYVPNQAVPPVAWILSTYPSCPQLVEQDFCLRKRIIDFINGVLIREPKKSLPKVLAQVESIRLRQASGDLNSLSKLLYDSVRKRTPPSEAAPEVLKKPKPNSAEEPLTISSEDESAESELSEIDDYNADDSEPDLNKLISSSIPRDQIVKILALKDSPQPLMPIEGAAKRSESKISNQEPLVKPTKPSTLEKLNPPQFKMNRNVETVLELWREWFQGLYGQPSIQSLEENYGTTWRQNNTEQKFFFSRRKVITSIEMFMENTEGMSQDEVLDLFESYRRNQGLRMKSLGKQLSTLSFQQLCSHLGVEVRKPSRS